MSKGFKARTKANAKAAPQLPQLPDELWEKILRQVAQREDANLAALRLVNKACARTHAFTQCGNAMKRVFCRKRLERNEELIRETESMLGTDQLTTLRAESKRGVCSGRIQGDLQMERFVWELCTTYSARRDKVGRMSKRQRRKVERVLLLKASIDALRVMGF